jgi:hypothetical protein
VPIAIVAALQDSIAKSFMSFMHTSQCALADVGNEPLPEKE